MDLVIEVKDLSNSPECETSLNPPIHTKERIAEELSKAHLALAPSFFHNAHNFK